MKPPGPALSSPEDSPDEPDGEADAEVPDRAQSDEESMDAWIDVSSPVQPPESLPAFAVEAMVANLKNICVVYTRYKMYTVNVTCDVNFTKEGDLDKAVRKVLKMFKQRFDGKGTHLDDESNSKRVYTYRRVSSDELRLLKKVLKTKGPQIYLSGIESNQEGDGAKKRGKTKRGAKPTPSVSSEHSVGSSVQGTVVEAASCSSSQGSEQATDNVCELVREARELCTRLQLLLDRLDKVDSA